MARIETRLELEFSTHFVARSPHVFKFRFERHDDENISWSDQSLDQKDHLLCKVGHVVRERVERFIIFGYRGRGLPKILQFPIVNGLTRPPKRGMPTIGFLAKKAQFFDQKRFLIWCLSCPTT